MKDSILQDIALQLAVLYREEAVKGRPLFTECITMAKEIASAAI